MGWLDEACYRDSPLASPDELARFHDPTYIAAVMDAERLQDLDEARRRRFNIGGVENPIFPEVFRRPATAAGGALLAARLLAAAPGIVHHPAGGTHHGRPDRASGFCYFNDPVLAILALLDRGVAPVLYVDVDAHHGDGVEAAFAGHASVRTLSVHEDGRWPRTGALADRAGGSALNLPVPAGLNDSEMELLLKRVILPFGRALAPAAVVLQCGADALADDPMSRLALSNRALWQVVASLRGLAPRYLVLGGGGYNPWSVARCWAGVWAVLNGIDPTAAPTAAARAVLEGFVWRHSRGRTPLPHWFDSIADAPRPGPVRPAIEAMAAAVLLP